MIYVLILSVRFGFYYDLIDDVFMRDIMSGSYTGSPDGHNVQTLYALGAFISLLYRLYRDFPWYGIFLLLCQMGSLYLVGVRLLNFCKKLTAKTGCAVFFTLFLWSVMLPHITASHFTFISAVLAASAIFLFITTPKELTVKQFLLQNIPSVLLVMLSYQLRREMLLLLFPFIGLAGLFRWSDEKKFFQRENYIKYGVVLLCIFAVMLVNRLLNFAAYGSGDWKEFLFFDDRRTVVYDYHLDIVTGGNHREYLSSIGLNDAQQELLSNYNFGLDETIDAELMSILADYAASDTAYAGTLPTVISDYIYRTLHATDAPYNYLVILLYLGIAFTGGLAALTRKETPHRWAFLWKLPLIGITRTALWMFILIQGRYPDRITHSLYYAEALLLSGMLCMQLANWIQTEKDAPAKKNGIAAGSALAVSALLCLFFLSCLPQRVGAVSADLENRQAAHRQCQEITLYCRAHPENYYFEDVYSTVNSSQKMFRDVDNSLKNYDIMGGWVCKSPLYYEKLEKFGIPSMEEGLLDGDNILFITSTDRDTDWLTAYYAEKGITVSMEQVDLIGDTFAVYRLEK